MNTRVIFRKPEGICGRVRACYAIRIALKRWSRILIDKGIRFWIKLSNLTCSVFCEPQMLILVEDQVKRARVEGRHSPLMPIISSVQFTNSIGHRFSKPEISTTIKCQEKWARVTWWLIKLHRIAEIRKALSSIFKDAALNRI